MAQMASIVGSKTQTKPAEREWANYVMASWNSVDPFRRNLIPRGLCFFNDCSWLPCTQIPAARRMGKKRSRSDAKHGFAEPHTSEAPVMTSKAHTPKGNKDKKERGTNKARQGKLSRLV